MTSEYVPTTEEVRIKYRLASGQQSGDFAEFDRWLAEHDDQVRVDYEARRNPSPILIENVDSQHAGAWLAEHEAKLIEKLADEIEFLNLPPTERVNAEAAAEVWLREQAQARRAQA